MKMHLLQHLLRVGMFGVVLASLSGQTLQNSKIMKTSFEKKGVTVEVSVPNTVSAGLPVEMVVNVTNAGSQSVIFRRWIRALGIQLVDSNKATPDMTLRGKRGPDAVIDNGISFATPAVEELKPGERHEWRVDLGTLFILKPGKYLVSVKPELIQVRSESRVSLDISTDPLGFAVQ